MLPALSFEPGLGRRRVLFIQGDQLFAEVPQFGVKLQQEPVLLQGAADQKARTAHQQRGEPENGEDLPEQPHADQLASERVSSRLSLLRSLRSSMCFFIFSRFSSRICCIFWRCSSVRMASIFSFFSSCSAFIFSNCSSCTARSCSCCSVVSSSSVAIRSMCRSWYRPLSPSMPGMARATQDAAVVRANRPAISVFFMGISWFADEDR